MVCCIAGGKCIWLSEAITVRKMQHIFRSSAPMSSSMGALAAGRGTSSSEPPIIMLSGQSVSGGGNHASDCCSATTASGAAEGDSSSAFGEDRSASSPSASSSSSSSSCDDALDTVADGDTVVETVGGASSSSRYRQPAAAGESAAVSGVDVSAPASIPIEDDQGASSATATAKNASDTKEQSPSTPKVTEITSWFNAGGVTAHYLGTAEGAARSAEEFLQASREHHIASAISVPSERNAKNDDEGASSSSKTSMPKPRADASPSKDVTERAFLPPKGKEFVAVPLSAASSSSSSSAMSPFTVEHDGIAWRSPGEPVFAPPVRGSPSPAVEARTLEQEAVPIASAFTSLVTGAVAAVKGENSRRADTRRAMKRRRSESSDEVDSSRAEATTTPSAQKQVVTSTDDSERSGKLKVVGKKKYLPDTYVTGG